MKEKAILTGLLFSNQDLKKLIVPLIIEQVLAITVGMVDTMMVSFAGESAVSGVSLVDMVNVMIINIFSALATGGAVITAQFMGSGKKDNACRSAKQLLLITVALSTLIAFIAIVVRGPLLRLFFGQIEADVMKNALIYLVISAFSYPMLAIYNSCAALFRAMGNSKVSMQTSILMNAVNIGGNALFIYGFHMGAAGAALGSLLGRGCAAAVMLVLIMQPKNPVYIDRKSSWHLEFRMIKNILRIGIPNGFENSLFQLGRILVVSFIAVFGTTQIAANAVANNIDALGCIPGQAMSLAMITVIGRCVGAGSFDQASYYIKKLLKITYIAGSAIILCIFLTLPVLLPIYNLSGETLTLARTLIFIHCGCAMFIWPLSFTLPNALRAASDVAFPLGVSIFSMVVFRIMFSYIFAIQFQMGAIGVWIAMIIDWVFRSLLFTLRTASGKWKTKCFL